MKKNSLLIKILAAALIVTAIAGLTAVAYGANTSSDPLITLSYLTDVYRSDLLSDVNTAVAAESRQLSTEFAQQTADLKAAISPSCLPPLKRNTVRWSCPQGKRCLLPQAERC